MGLVFGSLATAGRFIHYMKRNGMAPFGDLEEKSLDQVAAELEGAFKLDEQRRRGNKKT